MSARTIRCASSMLLSMGWILNIEKLKRRSQAFHQLEKQKRFLARQADLQPLPPITCRFSAENRRAVSLDPVTVNLFYNFEHEHLPSQEK